MGIIKKNLWVAGDMGRKECEVLFDTGASRCFVRENFAKEVSHLAKSPKPLIFRIGDESTITAEYTTDLHIDISGHSLFYLFLVVPKLPYEMIIGDDFLQTWKIKLDPSTEEFIIDEKALEIVLV